MYCAPVGKLGRLDAVALDQVEPPLPRSDAGSRNEQVSQDDIDRVSREAGGEALQHLPHPSRVLLVPLLLRTHESTRVDDLTLVHEG